MSSRSSQKNRWMSFLSDNVLLDVDEPQASGQFFWCNQQATEHADLSGEVGGSKAEGSGDRQTSSSNPKKRVRETAEIVKENVGIKAIREKQRRDRLNDRFVELCHMLEPGRPVKTDKAAILSDAVKAIAVLRTETAALKETNLQLREHVQELKGEKAELREEKTRLKVEKDKLEQQVKALTLPPGFMPHTAAVQAAAAAFAAQAQLAAAKVTTKPLAPTPMYPNQSNWPWLQPSSEPSEEQIRYPPVA